MKRSMRFTPLLLVACAGLTACATPENRREQYGPFYSYKPIPYKAPTPGDATFASPSETTVWYGPDQRKLVLGTWGMGGHLPRTDYPTTPWSVDRIIVSRWNVPGLHAPEIAARELSQTSATGTDPGLAKR